ncbi:F-box protein [Candidatus Odyssella thessalonicensis]|uniref:F-box protein n=1 Tax=Candidatus Odyssella thessalonicensis TaxID=84647 RepID=UPI000225B1E4|nr:F-box protein [Candidatus Odyssella thessalonicensis]
MRTENDLSFLIFPGLPIEIILTVVDFLPNSDLLNLRLVCHNLDALILSEYEICQTVTGRKECVPHKKAAYFKKCTKKLQDEFSKEIKIAAEAEGERLHAYVARHYFMLGNLYWEGLRRAPNHDQALYYYGEAYRRLDKAAYLRLGIIYDEGVILTKDNERASHLYSKYLGGRWYTNECNNAADAYYYLGRHFVNSYQASEEEKKKVTLLSKAASQGHLQALFELGKFYYRAEEGSKDFPRAIECVRKAGDLGHKKAYYWLAKTFEARKDIYQAVEFYKKAIPFMGFYETGQLHPTGVVYDLCKVYLKHQNIPGYLKDTVDLLKQASDQNISWAEYQLGRLYLKGQGVEKDTVKGAALLKKAADKPYCLHHDHDINVRMRVGIDYYKGKHIGKNDQQASQLLKFDFSFASRYFRAFLYRAKMMYEGRWYDEEKACFIQDTRQAVSLLERLAIKENYAEAQFFLVQIYLSDINVILDNDKALDLLRRVADEGRS